MNIQTQTSIEVTDPEAEVEVQIDWTGTRLWVNIDGRCLLRVGHSNIQVVVQDARITATPYP